MSQWNRIWILFVLVAVGLVLSWQQIGHRTAEVATASDRLLHTESPCIPSLSPCAALGVRRGVVLGPIANQPGRLVLHPAGFDPAAAELAATLHGADADAGILVPNTLIAERGYWALDMRDYDPDRHRLLRVEVTTEGRRLLAEFPLHAGGAERP